MSDITLNANERVNTKTREISIDYLRCLAALFIINSHYKPLYPSCLSFLSFGGLIGNCLFMLLSGYCLYNIKGNVFVWYRKRILRLYLPYMVIALPSFIASKDYSLGSVLELIFPISKYHFIASILVVYLLFYIMQYIHLKLKIKYTYFLVIFFLLQIASYFLILDYQHYELSDHFNVFELVSYINIMLIGAIIREKKETVKSINTAILGFICLIILILNIIFSKLFSFVGDKLVIWMLSIIFVSVITIMMVNNEYKLKRIKLVDFIASITLELYLVQMFFIRNCIENLVFPEGIVIGTIMIVGSAYILKLITDYAMSFFIKLFTLSRRKLFIQ